MSSLGFVAIFLLTVGAMAVPVFAVVWLLTWPPHRRQRRIRAERLRAVHSPTLRMIPVSEATEPPSRHAREAAVATIPRLFRTNCITPEEFARGSFDYTLTRRHAHWRRPLIDEGGYARATLEFAGEGNACLLIHRRIPLN